MVRREEQEEVLLPVPGGGRNRNMVVVQRGIDGKGGLLQEPDVAEILTETWA